MSLFQARRATMKFMRFKTSCTYTALAEQLELEGPDTEVDQIALDIGIPWILPTMATLKPMLCIVVWQNAFGTDKLQAHSRIHSHTQPQAWFPGLLACPIYRTKDALYSALISRSSFRPLI